MNPTFIQQDPSIERRRKLAQSMMQNVDRGPVRTGMEGLARVAQSLIGGYQQGKARRDQAAYDEGAQADLARIMSDYSQDVRPLSQHPGTSDIAMQIQMQQMAADKAEEASQASRAQGIEDYRTKKSIDQEYGGGKLPNEAQEFEFFQSLNPEQQKQYLLRKRAGVYKDFGGYQGEVNPLTGAVTNIGDKTVPPQSTAEHKLALTEATERGKKLSTIDRDIDSGNEFIGLINQAISHAGREAATGKSGVFNAMAMPGSDRKNFLVLAAQLKGKNFLAAFESLKGGGTITEVEGTKAEEAQARLNTAQSDEAYLAALNEMKELINGRVRKAEAFKNGNEVDSGGWGIVK